MATKKKDVKAAGGARARARAAALGPPRSKRRGRALTPPAIDELRARLALAVPEPFCELRFRSAWELLVATILSAQSTDRTVNEVTPGLFERWPTPRALADAAQEDVEVVVHRTGFFRNKAKAIRGAAAAIAARPAGDVPQTMEELVALPGVARKTANVVLGTAFGIASGVVVDTHVGRVARRLALTSEEDPVKVEAALTAAFPREEWPLLSHRLVLHGRYTCVAREPRCGSCPLAEICPSRGAGAPADRWEERAAAEARMLEARRAEEGFRPVAPRR